MNLSLLKIRFPPYDNITRMKSTDFDRLDIFIHGTSFKNIIYNDTKAKEDNLHSHFASKCDPESVKVYEKSLDSIRSKAIVNGVFGYV